MGTSIIDGTIEQIDAGRSNKKVSVFKSIVFRDTDGSTRTIKKAVVTRDLAGEIVPGASGRFYLFTSFDIKGMHGLRKADGTAIYDYPGKTNARLFLLIIPLSLAWITLRILDRGDVPLLGVLMIFLGLFGYYTTSKSARETRRQFDEDTAPVAAGA